MPCGGGGGSPDDGTTPVAGMDDELPDPYGTIGYPPDGIGNPDGNGMPDTGNELVPGRPDAGDVPGGGGGKPDDGGRLDTGGRPDDGIRLDPGKIGYPPEGIGIPDTGYELVAGMFDPVAGGNPDAGREDVVGK